MSVYQLAKRKKEKMSGSNHKLVLTLHLYAYEMDTKGQDYE